jgi:hypothetical protein
MSREEALHGHHVWHPHEYLDSGDLQHDFRGRQVLVEMANVGRAVTCRGRTREVVLGEFLSLSIKWRGFNASRFGEL